MAAQPYALRPRRWRDRHPVGFVVACGAGALYGLVFAVWLWPVTLTLLAALAIAVAVGRRQHRRQRSRENWAALAARADDQNHRWLENGDLW